MGYGGPERGVRSLSPWCRVWRGPRCSLQAITTRAPLCVESWLQLKLWKSGRAVLRPARCCCWWQRTIRSAVTKPPAQTKLTGLSPHRHGGQLQPAEDRSLYNIQSSERKGFVFILIALYKVRHFLHKATNIVTSFFAMFSIDMLYLNYAPEYKM